MRTAASLSLATLSLFLATGSRNYYADAAGLRGSADTTSTPPALSTGQQSQPLNVSSLVDNGGDKAHSGTIGTGRHGDSGFPSTDADFGGKAHSGTIATGVRDDSGFPSTDADFAGDKAHSGTIATGVREDSGFPSTDSDFVGDKAHSGTIGTGGGGDSGFPSTDADFDGNNQMPQDTPWYMGAWGNGPVTREAVPNNSTPGGSN